MLSRRRFLDAVSRTCGLAIVGLSSACRDERADYWLRLSEGRRVSLEPDFIGLGYEMSAVALPGLLDPANVPLVELIRGLGPSGVIRLGGIVADFSRYEPASASKALPRDTVYTWRDLERVRDLLILTGWRVIWSVNFAQGTVDEAVTLARDLTQVFGTRLLAIELGNEVDQYGRGSPAFRRSSYGYEDYRAEFLEWRAAIRRVAPSVAFASPDVAEEIGWIEQTAADFDGDLRLLPVHYYRAPASAGSMDLLAQPDPRLMSIADRVDHASRSIGVPWRVCEANSFSGGGLRGVSDAFIDALWLLDFLLLLAARGAAGVNVQTGINQLGFLSWYSPLRNEAGGVVAGVPYYGMRAFAFACEGCDQIGEIDVTIAGSGITTYVLVAAGRVRSLVAINRSSSAVALGLDEAMGFDVARLTAPNASSTSGVTFAGAAIGLDGRWSPARLEPMASGLVGVPAMSAVVLRRSIA